MKLFILVCTWALDIPESSRVSDVIEKLGIYLKIDLDCIRLIFNGVILKLTNILSDYDIRGGDTLYLYTISQRSNDSDYNNFCSNQMKYEGKFGCTFNCHNPFNTNPSSHFIPTYNNCSYGRNYDSKYCDIDAIHGYVCSENTQTPEFLPFYNCNNHCFDRKNCYKNNFS